MRASIQRDLSTRICAEPRARLYALIKTRAVYMRTRQSLVRVQKCVFSRGSEIVLVQASTKSAPNGIRLHACRVQITASTFSTLAGDFLPKNYNFKYRKCYAY